MSLPIDTEEVSNLANKAMDLSLEYAPKLAMAIVVFIIGSIIIRMVTGALKRLFDKKDYDETLERFLLSLTGIILKILLVITVVTMLGVQMTSFVAILGGAGLAIGMALSGTLQNFAGGVMLLIFRPYKVGDVIHAEGHTGKVEEIQIFNTVLRTPDNQTIIIPNSPISTNSLINYSAQGTRRVDLTIGIGYDDDIDEAKKVILDTVSKDSRIHQEPAPFIAVSELADSSVNFTLRLWGDVADYWGIYFDNLEAIKKALDAANISIPYPQTDLHLHTVEK
ncbi:mechanosensitive ion channel family protein [Kangiella sp. HZ709]|uniref:mechanosensitive ion channel family protein n=1 Tax=Kangiella sp. HZ709 TaxID=2666328 RepID=UPI0012B03CA6|nr:mechanosensitive ion channel domain-containing protein [Kangiella sp. HZ709]MRX28402.1 mechanosensitive ion channel [Kangiella sp. HZ709]